MEMTGENFKDIEGWGVDADPKSRPYYPVHKKQSNTGAHWSNPDRQNMDMEILKSSELPRITAVFGTSVPPSGLSGMLRRFAFKYTENQNRHWMTLLLADRINVVEGLILDLFHGHIPNIFKEMGLAADWKYDRKKYISRVSKITAAVAIPALLLYYLFKDKDKTRYA